MHKILQCDVSYRKFWRRFCITDGNLLAIKYKSNGINTVKERKGKERGLI